MSPCHPLITRYAVSIRAERVFVDTETMFARAEVVLGRANIPEATASPFCFLDIQANPQFVPVNIRPNAAQDLTLQALARENSSNRLACYLV